MKIFKRLICKHSYKTITNLYGDAIYHFNGRSIAECVKCGKQIINTTLDANCNEANKV